MRPLASHHPAFHANQKPLNARPRSFHAAIIFVLLGGLILVGCGSSAKRETPRLHIAIQSTQNPLVAAYRVGSGCSGQAMVEFGPDTNYGRTTSWYPVSAYQAMTIYVAGMRASTTYHMRLQRQCSGNTTISEDSTFTTGSLPSTPFPRLQVTRPDPPSLLQESPGIEMIDIIAASNQMQAFYTDRDGNPIWFYDVGAGNYPFTFKILSNGNLLFNVVNPSVGDSLLREIDLVGNTVREMNIGALKQKMQTSGFKFVPIGFHHDFFPLTNGHVLVLTALIQDFTDLPGYPGAIQVQGDAIIDLDSDWNPVWAWNSFDHLDINRHLFGLPDWTHANAVVYSPNDGNLLVSMRHQSWILKIDYHDGSGSGDILWRLGYQGDFALAQGDDPSQWFSFQHFPSIISQNGSQTTLAIWDNGDFRPLDTSGTTCQIPGPPLCYSRAAIFQVDENSKIANLVWENLPGFFSIWGGSVNQLLNGNVEFDLNAPLTAPAPNVASEVQEVTQTATPEVVWKMDIPLPMYGYRVYRVPSLYPDVTWQY